MSTAKVLPAWERWSTFFIGSLLFGGIVNLITQMMGPLTAEACRNIAILWLIAICAASLVFARFCPRTNRAYVATLAGGLALVLLFSLTTSVATFRYAQTQTFAYATLMVDEIREWQIQHNVFPDEATLISDGCMDRVERNWKQRAQFGVRFRHSDVNHPLSAIVGQRAVAIVQDRKGRSTVLVTGQSLAQGMLWDWDQNDWRAGGGDLR